MSAVQVVGGAVGFVLGVGGAAYFALDDIDALRGRSR
jgi:hypothetical protein